MGPEIGVEMFTVYFHWNSNHYYLVGPNGFILLKRERYNDKWIHWFRRYDKNDTGNIGDMVVREYETLENFVEDFFEDIL